LKELCGEEGVIPGRTEKVPGYQTKREVQKHQCWVRSSDKKDEFCVAPGAAGKKNQVGGEKKKKEGVTHRQRKKGKLTNAVQMRGK